MKASGLLLAIGLGAIAFGDVGRDLSPALAAQAPPTSAPPGAQERQVIEEKTSTLASRVAALTAKKADPALVADVDIYRKAAEYILRFPEEFATKDVHRQHPRRARHAVWRARSELEAGAPSWPTRKGHVVRAYVSRMDGSVQPYGLTIPDSYDGTKPVRLDIWQHGTNRTLNEVAFIIQQESDRPIPPEQDYIQLEPLGRTNVSYRWAGEADLFEALASVQQRYKIDPQADRAARILDGRRQLLAPGPASSRAMGGDRSGSRIHRDAPLWPTRDAAAVPGSDAALLRRGRLLVERVQHADGRLRRRRSTRSCRPRSTSASS